MSFQEINSFIATGCSDITKISRLGLRGFT